jgi:hypothetical protein
VRISKDVGPLIVLYEYQPSREIKYAAKFQDVFSGYLHITSMSRSADSIQHRGSLLYWRFDAYFMASLL